MALIPQKTTDNKFVDPTIHELAQGNYSTTDHGRVANFVASLEQGLKNNLTGTTARWLQYKAKGFTGEKMDQEAFDTSIAPTLGINYSEQTPNQLDFQIQSKLTDRVLADEAEGQNRNITNIAGNLAGGLLDPIGVLLPVAKADKVNLLLRAGKANRAATVAGTSTFTNLLALNTALEAPYGAMKLDMGDDYTAEHLKTSLMFNPVFSGVFAGFRGYSVRKRGLKIQQSLEKKRAYVEFMNGQRDNFDANLTDAVNILGDAGSPAIKKIIDENPRLKDIAEGRVKEEDLTPEDLMNISAGMHMVEVSAKLEIMAAKLADDYLARLDEGGSIRGAYKDYEARVNRLTEALTTGNTSKLTPEDVQWLQDNVGIFVQYPENFTSSPRKGDVVLIDGVGLSTKGARQAGYHQAKNSPDGLQGFLNNHSNRIQLMVKEMADISLMSDGNNFLANFPGRNGPRNYAEAVLDKGPVFDDFEPKLLKDVIGDIARRDYQGREFTVVNTAKQDPKFRKQVAKEFQKEYNKRLAVLERKYKEIKNDQASVFGQHSEVVSHAHKMINELFLKGESKIPKPQEVTAKSLLELTKFYAHNAGGWKGLVDEEGVMSLAPAGVFQSSYAGVPMHLQKGNNYAAEMFMTTAHEHVHQIALYAPYYWNKLLKVADGKAIKPILDDDIRQAGYDPVNFRDERPSVLIEWALTRDEFWAALKKQDADLHKKFSLYVKGMMDELKEYLILARPGSFLEATGPLKERLDALTDAPKVATEIGNIIAYYRSESSLSNMYQNIPNVKKEISADKLVDEISEYTLSKLRPSYENPIYQKRAAKQDKFNADATVFLEDTINRVLGDEEVLPLLITVPGKIIKTQARKEHIVRTQEALVDKGFDTIAPLYEEILTNLQASIKRRASVLSLLKGKDYYTFEEVFASLKADGATDELLARIGFIFSNQDLSRLEKIGRINNFFQQEDLAMVLRRVHDATIRDNVIALAKSQKTKKGQVAQIKTLLDGSQRKGVKRSTSIQRAVEAQIIKDQIPIIEYLVKHDLLEIFLGEDPTKYMSSYTRQWAKKSDRERYDEDLTAASKEFHINVMNSIRTGVIADKFKGIKVFEDFVELVKTVNRGMLAEINSLGVNIRESQDFSGYSVKYDPLVVKEMGLTDFVNYMRKAVDMQMTANLHGGVMTNKAGELVAFDPIPFFTNMYNSVVDGTFFDDGTAANKSIVGALRKSAKIAYKDEFKADAIVTFGNFKNLGRMLLDQIRSRSEKIALVKNLGHDPYGNLTKVVNGLGLSNAQGFKTLDMTMKQVAGLLDDPVNITIAQNFQKVRQVSNIANLAGSGASALSDIPLTLTTLQYLGVDLSFRDFITTYKKAIDTQFRGNNKEMAAWFRSQGAAFDLITRTMAQRVVTGESIDGGWIAAANQLLFEINGLNRITATHQQIFIDYLSSALAVELAKPKPSSTLIARLKEFGFTDREIKYLPRFIEETPDGIKRLAPSSVTNALVQTKIQGFYLQYMKEAVLEPDIGAQAITRLGLEAGTFGGETIRTAFQYSSFMLGMSRVVYRRFMNGYQGEGKHNAFAMSHLIAYLGAAIAFAYMTTVFKDLSKFKEPINLFNMSMFDFNRILSQSGVLGVMDLPFNAVRFNDPTALFAPILGQGLGVLTGDPEEAVKAYTGQNYPIIGPVIQQAIGFVAGETLNSIQKDYVSYMRGLSDDALDQQIDALEAAGALRVVNTSEGPKLLASSEEGATAVLEKKRRMALDTE
jgi:hypothetical protein